MTIQEFFELSTGKWFSQSTKYGVGCDRPQNGRSDLIIEDLSVESPEIQKIYQDAGLNSPSNAAKISWNGSLDGSTKKVVGSTIIAAIPDSNGGDRGKLLRQVGTSTLVSDYEMGDGEVFILITPEKDATWEERIWFGSENLRLRTVVKKQGEDTQSSSFYSEIRMGGGKPPAKTETTAANA
ncbi:phycobiliprotein lyase [Merismopedia glauca]|uniref:Chromophore lyase CpcS/CpeS n=1 Tax=Merismopedia glauca CCAP 1448/3 TaxID=1296344 RepID=A0A2T1C1Z3_9CYAN|nr:phycobiliprotein lyase [Merismopedia glauca]PSB02281.1 phycobiliprotein lyase [Merismopedia glauca CCAP 1448/3]